MATPAPADKVKDKEYTNWLKVTLALYYMKSGLHTFIQSEIDCLHQSLVQKIYRGHKVPLPPCSMCDASHVIRNKYTGVWAFPRQCRSYCDVWLHELLNLHTNPKSERIYWDNSRVPTWPFKSWECAKVFMPRGQQSANDGPAKSDAQALMVLLDNCKHFHPKLSQQGQTLTRTVSTIRNKVMHASEMKVSDADRMSFMQQIIQLLEDPVHLKSLKDCKAAVSNIHKIDNDSVDVFFNVNQEMMALSSVVKELRLELGMNENKIMDNVESLKEEYRQLREQIAKRFEDVEKKLELHGECTTKRFEGVEKKLELQGERVQENVVQLHDLEVNVELHQQRLGAVENKAELHVQRLGAVEENVEIHEERLEAVEENVEIHEERLGAVEENVEIHEERLEAVEENVEIHEERLGAVEENVEIHEERLGAVEQNVVKLQEEIGQMTRENISCVQGTNGQKRSLNVDQDEPAPKRRAKQQGTKEQKRGLSSDQGGPAPKRTTKQQETAPKRRPESDGLKQLKNETEDILDTFRRKGFIQTTQTVEAKKLLQDKRFVVISGNPGEGKTSTAFHLIDDDDYRNQHVVVKSLKDWKKVDTDWVKIVVLEDIFGRYDLDPGCLKKWVNKYLQTIQDHVDVGKLQVIITIRKDILLKAYSKLKSFKLFSSDMSLILSSEKLKHSDKMNILNRELQRKEKDMNVGEKEQCIAKFSGMIGFPQCCSLFAQDKYLFSQGPDFFKSPEKFLVDNIRNLEPNSFLSLAFLFCIGEIGEEYLSPSQIKKSKNYLPVLKDLANYLHISFDDSTVISLRESYDHYLGLYVKKVLSYKHHSGGEVSKSCIHFSHATVCEAVGQVLGDRCPEMVVKHGGSEYLYQRTYTAEAKDDDSQNVFIPVSVYGLLAKRMVHDVVEKGIVESAAKHSALKQKQFLMKLTDELHKGNRIRDFVMANPYTKHRIFYEVPSDFFQNISEGTCTTFLQHVLQSDADTVKLVYSHFMQFLACTHNNNSSDCWQCKEKQKLLELALYYNNFEIADRLIAINACYTHVSLCNAARHGDLNRVQTIIEHLKKSLVFNPECVEAKEALYRAYLSRSQDVTEILLKEGIMLDRMHVQCVVQQGDIHVLMKVVEHLKCHNMWHPSLEQDDKFWYYFHPHMYSNQFGKVRHAHMFSNPFGKEKPALNQIPCSTALYIAYCYEKFDIADYLVKNEAKVSLKMLAAVTEHGSKKAVARVIQHLKVNCIWDPHCDDACEVLGSAYRAQKFDVCDLLIQEGVSLTMKNFPCVILRSLDDIKNVVKWFKDNDSWNPRCNDASEALTKAYREKKYDVCGLLIQEGVSLTMKNLPHVVGGFDDLPTLNYLPHVVGGSEVSLEAVKLAMQHLKDTKNWVPSCEDASKALEVAYKQKKYDVCDLLIQEGVSLTMKNFPHAIFRSLDDIKKVVKRFKDTDSWNPRCNDASKALIKAYREKRYDVCDLLIQEGVALTMKNLLHVVVTFEITFEVVKKVVQHLKDAHIWDPKCDDASEALEEAYTRNMYDVCDLLIQERVSVTMKHIPHAIWRSLDYVITVVKLLKDTDRWFPKCNDASQALTTAYCAKKNDVCDLLIQEGVLLTMKNLPHVIKGLEISLEAVKKAVQHLKDTNNWDPKCEDASKALEEADTEKRYDVYDLLIQEGVSLTMKNLPHVVGGVEISLEAVKKALQHLKDTHYWDPKCEDASEALLVAFGRNKYDVCDLLIQEGVSLTMKNLLYVVCGFEISLEAVKKAVQHLKDTRNWNPKCEDASKVLEEAYKKREHDVCDLLIQEGVSLTMKNLLYVVWGFEIPLEAVKKAVQHLKDTRNWDSKCEDASKALEEAYKEREHDVCDLLIQEGVSLTMKNLLHVVVTFGITFEVVKKVVQHLKDTHIWNPKCDDASEALEKAYRNQMYDVYDLLIQEGVSVTMKHIPHAIRRSMDYVKTVVKQLKDTDSWDPTCNDASQTLTKAFRTKKNDVCDLLIQEGVSLTMKNLPHAVGGLDISLKAVKKAVQHLKHTSHWNPKCDDALKALEEAYREKRYDVCDLLIQEGVSPTMKNLPHVVGGFDVSLEAVKKAVQHLKVADNWDPKCSDASKALEDAYGEQRYAVCDLLNQEGVSLTMKNIPGVVYRVSLEHVKKAIQHLNKYLACDMLIEDRVSLTIKKHHVTKTLHVPLETVKKAIEHLKDRKNWDAKSDEASEALANAYIARMYDVCDLLLEEAVSLTMKNLPRVVGGFEVTLEAVKKAMQHLKATDNWDPKCDDASKALANAYSKQKYDVCDLLIQEGVSLTMQTLDGVVEGFHVSLEAVKKALQHLKDSDNWDPSCEHASKALENAYVVQKYDVCNLLIQDGVSLSMKNVPGVVYSVSLEYVKKAIQHLNRYDLFNLLVLNRVSLAMKNLPCAEGRSHVSLETVKNAMQHLKDTNNWDPRCGDASKALANAYSEYLYDVCDLLLQEGVLPNNEESSSCGGGTSGIIGSS